MFCASIEHKTRHNTQFSEMVLDSWERPRPKDKTKESNSFSIAAALIGCKRFAQKWVLFVYLHKSVVFAGLIPFSGG